MIRSVGESDATNTIAKEAQTMVIAEPYLTPGENISFLLANKDALGFGPTARSGLGSPNVRPRNTVRDTVRSDHCPFEHSFFLRHGYAGKHRPDAPKAPHRCAEVKNAQYRPESCLGHLTGCKGLFVQCPGSLHRKRAREVRDTRK